MESIRTTQRHSGISTASSTSVLRTTIKPSPVKSDCPPYLQALHSKNPPASQYEHSISTTPRPSQDSQCESAPSNTSHFTVTSPCPLQLEQSILPVPWQNLQLQNLYPLGLRQSRPLHRPMVVGFGGWRIRISACLLDGTGGVRCDVMWCPGDGNLPSWADFVYHGTMVRVVGSV
jgi:hypothetical protein